MNDDVRTRLVEGGVDLVERDGVQALSARNLAAAAGTSTMAVYTQFGGMTGALDVIAGEVFARFARALMEVPHTDDPVADFLAMGTAYRAYALANPQRYQLMFGTSVPAVVTAQRVDLTVTGASPGQADPGPSFQALVVVVRRMITAGRIRDDGELAIAGRLWSVVHGAVTLEMAGFFGHDGHGVSRILGPLTVDVLVGMGDEPDRAARSFASTLASTSTSSSSP